MMKLTYSEINKFIYFIIEKDLNVEKIQSCTFANNILDSFAFLKR